MTLPRLSLAALMCTALATAAIAAAHTDAIKARQQHMKDMGAQMKVLGEMAQDKVPYDAAAASAAAATLAEITAMDQSGYWVEGSDINSGAETKALPAIWENMADFEAKTAALNTAAMNLAGVAGNGLDALKAGFGPVGAACGDCHQTYRAR